MLSCELVANTSCFFDRTSFAVLVARACAGGPPLAEGSDRFRLAGVILPWRRVTATGRHAEHEPGDLSRGAGLGVLEPPPPLPAVCLPDIAREGLEVTVRANFARDPESFLQQYSLAIAAGATALTIPLRRAGVMVTSPADGVFHILLGPEVLAKP